MFGTRMCGQTLLFIVLANCAIREWHRKINCPYTHTIHIVSSTSPSPQIIPFPSHQFTVSSRLLVKWCRASLRTVEYEQTAAKTTAIMEWVLFIVWQLCSLTAQCSLFSSLFYAPSTERLNSGNITATMVLPLRH